MSAAAERPALAIECAQNPACAEDGWEALVARSPRAVRPRLRLALAYRALERPADAARMLAPIVETRRAPFPSASR
jgi:hypothetical protein